MQGHQKFLPIPLADMFKYNETWVDNVIKLKLKYGEHKKINSKTLFFTLYYCIIYKIVW